MRNASDHQDEMRSIERNGNRNTYDTGSEINFLIRAPTGDQV